MDNEVMLNGVVSQPLGHTIGNVNYKILLIIYDAVKCTMDDSPIKLTRTQQTFPSTTNVITKQNKH